MSNLEIQTENGPLESTSNYQMKPNLQDSFKASNVKEIIRDVLQDILKGNQIQSILFIHFKKISLNKLFTFKKDNNILLQMYQCGQNKLPIKLMDVLKIYQ